MTGELIVTIIQVVVTVLVSLVSRGIVGPIKELREQVGDLGQRVAYLEGRTARLDSGPLEHRPPFMRRATDHADDAGAAADENGEKGEG